MKSIRFFSLAVLLTFAGMPVVFSANPEETAESLAEIQARATAEKKPILLEFTGSDWCPPCQMMNKQVFSTETFQKFAASDLVFVKLDFPRSKPQSDEMKERNQGLAEQFNIEGFPTVILLSPEGKELAREVGFMGGGPEKLIAWIQKAQKQ